MLRRFETYNFDPHAPAADRARLRTAFRDSSRYIPDVLHSAVGENVSDAPVQLVWEHAYESVATSGGTWSMPSMPRVGPVPAGGQPGAGRGRPRCRSRAGRLHLCRSRLLSLIRRAFGWSCSTCKRRAPRRSTRCRSWPESPGPRQCRCLPPTAWRRRGSTARRQLGVGPRWSHLWELGFEDPDAHPPDPPFDDRMAPEAGRRWEEVPGVTAAMTISYRIEPGWGYSSSP